MVNWPEKCAVVIPCHNEELSVANVVREARRLLPLVLVVDDCSEDRTAVRAAEAGAEVVRRLKHPGKGAAIKAGIEAATARECAWAITIDGDGQHRPEDIPAFLRCAEQTGAALVVGNRMHRAEEIPWVRRAVNRWMSRRISSLASRTLPDSQCGFRLIDLRAWATVQLATDHFEIESEMLLAFVKAGWRVEFVPVQVVVGGRRSHINPLLDSWRWLRWWRRVRLERRHLSRPGTCADDHSACASARGQNML